MTDKQQEIAVNFGAWLGRRQAFSLLTGRCSAADAECLRELRASKKYRELGLTWDQVCKQHLGISRPAADKIIHQIEEFGPEYFVLSQVTGITPDEYRRIAGAVSNHALLHAGEEIVIRVDNAPRLAEAVESLLRSALPAPAAALDAVAEFDRSAAKVERALPILLAELGNLCAMRPDTARRVRLQTVIGETASKLKMLDMQVRV
jgi:hypothetical protein